MTTDQSDVTSPQAQLSQRQKHLAFAGVLTVLFLASTNLTVVGTALPRIIAELEGFNLYAWAFTSFSLTSTVTLPIYGRLSDVYGRRVIFLIGIVLFTIGSILCGMSQSMVQLILFRTVQGLGGGALMAMSWSSIGDIFTPRERGRYQGYTGAVFGISSVVGPLLGGLITDTLGWRWVFFVSVPFAAVAFWAIARFLPANELREDEGVDFIGALLLLLGIVPLLLALTWAGVDYPWGSPVIVGLISFSIVLLIAFGWWQTRSRSPIIAPELFGNRTFNLANAAAFLTGVGLFGAVIYLPLYVQGVQAGSAAESGFALTPLMIGMVTASAVAGQMVTRTGRYRRFINTGLVIMILGFLLASTMGPETPVLYTVIFMVILGLGIGPTNSLYVLAVQNALPARLLGTVTSANQFFRQIGGTIGVTVFGALVTGRIRQALQTQLPAGFAEVPAETMNELSNPNLLTNPEALEEARTVIEGVAGAGSFETFVASLRLALSDGIGLIFLVSMFLTILALLASIFLPRVDLQGEAPTRAARTGRSR